MFQMDTAVSQRAMRTEHEIRAILKAQVERAIRRFSAAESVGDQREHFTLLDELDVAVKRYVDFTRNGTIPADLRGSSKAS